jgi:hypothetical protein
MNPKHDIKIFDGPCPLEKMDIKQAIQYGCLERCQELIESKSCDINQPDLEGCYVLHWAAINDRVEVVK